MYEEMLYQDCNSKDQERREDPWGGDLLEKPNGIGYICCYTNMNIIYKPTSTKPLYGQSIRNNKHTTSWQNVLSKYIECKTWHGCNHTVISCITIHTSGQTLLIDPTNSINLTQIINLKAT